MRPRAWLFYIVILGWPITAQAAARQPIHWQPNLETARRLAVQSNRLVLVHFWADWCGRCKEMDRNVFSQSEVAAAVGGDFVPVKINTDHYPETAQRFRITLLPCDVVLNPQGAVVGKIVGALGAPQYTARLGQIAESVRTASPGQMTEYDRRGPERDSGAASFLGSRGGMPTGNQGVGMPPPTRFSQSSQSTSGGQAPTSPKYAKTPPEGGPIGSLDSAHSASVTTQTLGSTQASPPQRPPAWNPPLGLEGYCPIELGENQRWVPGDTRWGLTFRGRTYLFAGPAQRDRFDAAPERYAPVVSGNDVVLLVEQGREVAGRREYGAWFWLEGQPDGKGRKQVFLFSNEATRARFDANPSRYVDAAQRASAARRGSTRHR
jgi:thiol-disulfide isomerase/thioredoxin/YHS domain-containing protein